MRKGKYPDSEINTDSVTASGDYSSDNNWRSDIEISEDDYEDTLNRGQFYEPSEDDYEEAYEGEDGRYYEEAYEGEDGRYYEEASEDDYEEDDREASGVYYQEISEDDYEEEPGGYYDPVSDDEYDEYVGAPEEYREEESEAGPEFYMPASDDDTAADTAAAAADTAAADTAAADTYAAADDTDTATDAADTAAADTAAAAAAAAADTDTTVDAAAASYEYTASAADTDADTAEPEPECVRIKTVNHPADSVDTNSEMSHGKSPSKPNGATYVPGVGGEGAFTGTGGSSGQTGVNAKLWSAPASGEDGASPFASPSGEAEDDKYDKYEETRSSKSKKVLFVLTAVVVIAAVAVAAFFFTRRMPAGEDSNKIVKDAFFETLNSGTRLYTDLRLKDALDWIVGGDFGIEVRVKRPEGEFALSFAEESGTQQLKLTSSVPGKSEIWGTATLEEDSLLLTAPAISSDVLSYGLDSGEELPGDIRPGGLDTEAFFRTLSLLKRVLRYRGELRSDVSELIDETFKKIKIHSIPQKSYDINGKDIKCRGYEFKLESELLDPFSEQLISTVKTHCDLGNDADNAVFAQAETLMDSYIKRLDGAVVRVYINDNRIVEIMCEGENGFADLTLKSLNAPMDNFRLEIRDGSETFELSQDLSFNDSIYVYSYEIKRGDEAPVTFAISYDPFDKRLVFTRGNEFSQPADTAVLGDTIQLYLKSNSNRISLSVDKFRNLLDDGAALSGEGLDISIRNDPRLKRADGELVEVSTLDKDELDWKLYDYSTRLDEVLSDYNIDFMIYDTLDELGLWKSPE